MAELFRRDSWRTITRMGMPKFVVARHAIETLGVRYEVGAPFPETAVPHQSRLRQMYEQRMIEPVPGSVSEQVATPVKAAARHHVPAALPSVSAPVVDNRDNRGFQPKRVKARR